MTLIKLESNSSHTTMVGLWLTSYNLTVAKTRNLILLFCMRLSSGSVSQNIPGITKAKCLLKYSACLNLNKAKR